MREVALEAIRPADLNPSARDLFVRVSALKSGPALVAFFHRNLNTYATTDSIVSRLNQDGVAIEPVLHEFERI